MRKITYIFLFCFFITFMLINSFEIIESIRLSFKICINNLFPTLIPFMLLSNILINYDFIYDISYILSPLMKKFKVNKNCAFAFVMSILSGTPSNSVYLLDLYKNNLININDLKKCLNFCHFNNPIFILGTVGYTFLHDKRLGLIILISHYISSFMIGFLGKSDSKNTYAEINSKNKKNFVSVLKESINSTIDTLLLILGIITTFLIITCLVNKILNINANFKFIYGIIEITQGLKYLSLSNLNITVKAAIASFLISFGGFCIHMQVFSIIDNKKVRYLPYLISRIFGGLLSSIITIILINLFY